MTTNYAQLHQYLISALADLKEVAARNDIDCGSINIRASFDYDGELEIKYTVSKKYRDGPTGNSLEPVLEEFFRREGWELANNVKLLTSD
jgi:hypothetical protein